MGQIRYRSVWSTLLEIGVDGQCIACFISYLDWPPCISISPTGMDESHYYSCAATLRVSDISNGLDIHYLDISPCIHFVSSSCCLLMFRQHIEKSILLAHKIDGSWKLPNASDDDDSHASAIWALHYIFSCLVVLWDFYDAHLRADGRWASDWTSTVHFSSAVRTTHCLSCGSISQSN